MKNTTRCMVLYGAIIGLDAQLRRRIKEGLSGQRYEIQMAICAWRLCEDALKDDEYTAAITAKLQKMMEHLPWKNEIHENQWDGINKFEVPTMEQVDKLKRAAISFFKAHSDQCEKERIAIQSSNTGNAIA